MTFVPTIAPAVWDVAPGFRAFSLHVQRPNSGLCNTVPAAQALEQAVATVREGQPVWAEVHLAAWAEVFRRFGAKPQRTPCSAQSLRERVLKTRTLAPIDPVVDLYNAVSLRYAIPVGGENAGAYRGSPQLVVASGDEVFDTMKNGEPATENPDPGEVVWRDDVGVTCRRWNWRQGVRMRIDASTFDMWFILESLPEMPLEALEEAGEALLSGLNALFGETISEKRLLQQG